MALLETLRDVTSGKIYVEMEGARLTRRLAKVREAKGDLDGAAEIMQELQVETWWYGASGEVRLYSRADASLS